MINIAVLGPGKISHRFMEGMKDVIGAKVVAIASRDTEKARQYANTYGVEKAYTYVDLYNDESVDAVYIATPPFAHKEQILNCLKSNKHVICEKPLMKSEKDLRECFEYAKSKHLILMEAQKAVFTPTYNKIKEIIDSKILKDIKLIEASYCYDGKFPVDHWVYEKEKAGGGMYDVGVYPLSVVLTLNNSEILNMSKESIEYLNCDGFTDMLIKFKNNVIANVKGSIIHNSENVLKIYGSNGYLKCEKFWRAKSFELVIDNELIIHEFDFNSEFTFEIQHFVDCINKGLTESPILTEELSCLMIKLIDEKNTESI